MTTLLTGLLIFFGIHSMSVIALPLRNRLAAKSALAWKGFYSIASVLGIALIVMGYGELKTSPIILYSTPFWMHYVSAALYYRYSCSSWPRCCPGASSPR